MAEVTRNTPANSHKFAVLLVGLFLVLFTGCSQDSLTAPETTPETPAGPVVASPEAIAKQAVAMNDISDRLLPSLEDPALAATLAPHVSQVAKALEAGNEAAAHSSVAKALEIMSAYEAVNGTATPDAGDLGSIYLNLWYADSLIDG